jgi:hypothetical protein
MEMLILAIRSVIKIIKKSRTGIEPISKVLQTSALPLCYLDFFIIFSSRGKDGIRTHDTF